MSYKPFTTRHDQVVHLRDICERLSADEMDACRGWMRRYEAGPISVTIDRPPLTVLIDLSGSMRNGQLLTAAVGLSALGDALDGAGIPFEFLGFTTSAWKGGKSKEDWRDAGRPRNPGRLGDLLHVVIKDVGETWSGTRDLLPGLLKQGLLKENVDGEALEWAAGRMREQAAVADRAPAGLIVITDGAPCDHTTLDNNHADILKGHLRDVLAANTDLEIRTLDLDNAPKGAEAIWPNRTILPMAPRGAEELQNGGDEVARALAVLSGELQRRHAPSSPTL